VYLGAAATGAYHSACYFCYTKNKIDVTKYKKLVRASSQNWCNFGLCKTVPGWYDICSNMSTVFTIFGGYQQTEINIASLTGEYYIVCATPVYTDSGDTIKGVAKFNQLYLTV